MVISVSNSLKDLELVENELEMTFQESIHLIHVFEANN